MDTLYTLEMHLMNLNQLALINYCFEKQLIKNLVICNKCQISMNFTTYKRNKDGYAWRCMNKKCTNYKKYLSIRLNSFFENFKIEIKVVLQIIIRYASKTSRNSMTRYFGQLNKNYVTKVIKNLIDRMPHPDYTDNKLGGPGLIVQVDETMLNYKCKSHRGRSPTNRTDALCIIEYAQNITRVFASVISDKTSATMIPIICSQVAPNSIIWTDEHRSYSCLSSFNFIHNTVCHKYQFVNSLNGVNTQAVESFNNCIKYEIKNRKGIYTQDRNEFLKEVCWLFNNKDNLIAQIFNIMKISN
jgi:transposase-like protein